MTKNTRYIYVALILVLLAALVATGCRRQAPTPPVFDLSRTMVPNVDLDMYVYMKQDKPTRIPAKMLGASSDLSVESAALWGIAKQDGFAVAGALTLGSASDASRVSQVSAGSGAWTAVADRTVYFVRGSGPGEESLKSAISRNDFKYYNDSNVLGELALLPTSGNTKPAAVVVVKPGQSMVTALPSFAGQQASSMLNVLVTAGQLQSTVAGVYAPAQIDLADLWDRLERGTALNSEIGFLVALKSGLPGPVIGPIATNYLASTGFTMTTVSGVDVYRGIFNLGGKGIPVLMAVQGSRIYTAVSGKESYAQSLLTGIKR